MTIGKPRNTVLGLPSYKPGKSARQAEVEHGAVDAIKLASNESPLVPLASVQAAIVAASTGVNRYPDHGAVALRERLAQKLGLNANQIGVGAGSSGLLQQVLLCYVDDGDEVVYPWRSFEAYPILVQMVGGVSVRTPLNDDLSVDFAALTAAVTPATKVVFLATPNNPTGISESTADIAAFVQSIPDDVIVLVDEAYREFNDPAAGDPVVDLLPRFRNVVVTRTMSKAHGLAGLRVGYAVGDPEIITTLDKTLMMFSVNLIAQAAALAVLDAQDEVDKRVADIVAERARVSVALSELGVRTPKTAANFVYLPLGEDTERIGLALETKGVVTRAFAGDGIRVTIGTAAENDRFLATFAEVR